MRQLLALGTLPIASSVLGSQIAAAQCSSCDGDLNGDDRVTIDELVKAVNSALTGCGDNVTCTSDGDCDADEVCTNGTCAGRPDPCSSDADCDPDEACVSGNCQ